MKERKNTHADWSQKFEAGKLVEKHCKKDANGYAVYDAGWSDAVIAKQVGVVPSTVAHIRHKQVGKLSTGNGAVNMPQLSARFSEMTEAFGDLRAEVDKLTKRVDQLESAVTAPEAETSITVSPNGQWLRG